MGVEEYMNLIILILLVYGLTKIITSGSIFDPIKKKLGSYDSRLIKLFVELINCPLCTGFWVGALIGWFYGPFQFWNILFNGAFYSGCGWIIHCLVQYLGNGYDPNRSVILQIPDEVNVKMANEDKKDINNSGKQVLKG